jgi:hypothetical protein
MIHVVAMKCLMITSTILVALPILIHIEFYEGVGDLKIEESKVLCTDSTALGIRPDEKTRSAGS